MTQYARIQYCGLANVRGMKTVNGHTMMYLINQFTGLTQVHTYSSKI